MRTTFLGDGDPILFTRDALLGAVDVPPRRSCADHSPPPFSSPRRPRVLTPESSFSTTFAYPS